MTPPAGDFTAVLDAVRGVRDRHRRVVVVLLDAFGWRFVERHGDHPLLRRLGDEGTLVPLASQFPSTTTAHVTTMHTGRPVGAHGLYEWRIWEPALRRVVTPLLFSYAGDRARDTLAADGVRMEDIFPAGPTLYEELADGGAASVVLHPAAFSPSTYDGCALRGAALTPYSDLREGLAELVRRAAAAERCYAYLYFDGIDAAGHLQGPSSAAFDATARGALDAVHDVFFGPGAVALEDTLLVLTADHGQVDTSPERVDHLDVLWPQLPAVLERDARDEPIPPAGSARDVFLHVRPDWVEEAVERLGAALGERATVHATADLVARGVFGEAGPRLRERLGSVCVLPARDRMAWLSTHPDVERRFVGHHGGLHPDEAQTFMGVVELG